MTVLPFSRFREHGLLWLVNRCVFHPRGYALAFDVQDDGEVTGWKLIGDGTEPWHYDPDYEDPDGWTEDTKFAAAEAFLAILRAGYDCGCFHDHHNPDCPLVAAGLVGEDDQLHPENDQKADAGAGQ